MKDEKGLNFEETPKEFDKIYKKEDPWNLKTKKEEQLRIKRLISFIPKDIDSILDIGCGEGIFTHEIKKKINSKYIRGIDVCRTAIERGINNFSEIEFIWGDFLDIDTEIFSLVIVSEVLYYVKEKNLPKFIDKLRYSTNHYVLICNTDFHNEDKYFRLMKRYFKLKRLQFYRSKSLDMKSYVISLWKVKNEVKI